MGAVQDASALAGGSMPHRLVTQALFLFLCVFASAFVNVSAGAQANLTAEQIMNKNLNQDAFGWDEAETTVRMTLVEANGTRKERIMENLRRRKGGMQQAVVRFRSPAEVAG